MLSAGKHWGKHAPEPALRPFVMHQGGEMEEEITLYERGYHGACCGCREVGHLIRDRLHRGGNGNPRQYSCLENPMDWESWEATVHGVAKSRTRLSDFTSFHRGGVMLGLQGWACLKEKGRRNNLGRQKAATRGWDWWLGLRTTDPLLSVWITLHRILNQGVMCVEMSVWGRLVWEIERRRELIESK